MVTAVHTSAHSADSVPDVSNIKGAVSPMVRKDDQDCKKGPEMVTGENGDLGLGMVGPNPPPCRCVSDGR